MIEIFKAGNNFFLLFLVTRLWLIVLQWAARWFEETITGPGTRWCFVKKPKTVSPGFLLKVTSSIWCTYQADLWAPTRLTLRCIKGFSVYSRPLIFVVDGFKVTFEFVGLVFAYALFLLDSKISVMSFDWSEIDWLIDRKCWKRTFWSRCK